MVSDKDNSYRPSNLGDDLTDRLERFAEISGGWFWETDEQHRFTFFSRSVEAMTGLPPEWHYGKSRIEIGAPDAVDPKIWLDHIASLDRYEEFDDFIFLRSGPDGEKWMCTSGKPRFDHRGAIGGGDHP